MNKINWWSLNSLLPSDVYICIGKIIIIGPDNGLLPGRRRAIIWTNAGILTIGPLGTSLSEMLIKIYIFSFKKMHLKMPSGNWRPFCLGLNGLITLIPLLSRFLSVISTSYTAEPVIFFLKFCGNVKHTKLFKISFCILKFCIVFH